MPFVSVAASTITLPVLYPRGYNWFFLKNASARARTYKPHEHTRCGRSSPQPQPPVRPCLLYPYLDSHAIHGVAATAAAGMFPLHVLALLLPLQNE